MKNPSRGNARNVIFVLSEFSGIKTLNMVNRNGSVVDGTAPDVNMYGWINQFNKKVISPNIVTCLGVFFLNH